MTRLQEIEYLKHQVGLREDYINHLQGELIREANSGDSVFILMSEVKNIVRSYDEQEAEIKRLRDAIELLESIEEARI